MAKPGAPAIAALEERRVRYHPESQHRFAIELPGRGPTRRGADMNAVTLAMGQLQAMIGPRAGVLRALMAPLFVLTTALNCMARKPSDLAASSECRQRVSPRPRPRASGATV